VIPGGFNVAKTSDRNSSKSDFGGPTRIGLHVPAEVAMVGDAKLVLRQLCDAARANDWKRPGQSDWLQEVADVRANFNRVIVEQEHTHHDDIPIHPARGCAGAL